MNFKDSIILFLCLVLIIVISTIGLSGCETNSRIVVQTKYEVFVPNKVERPLKPKLEELNSNKSISSKENLTKVQNNLIYIKVYINNLINTIETYEKEIDNLNTEKNKLELNNLKTN